MLKIIISFIFTSCFVLNLIAQNVGVGTNLPLAILDVNSTNSAFLPPRLTSAQRNSINPKVAGMVIYNSTNKHYNFYNGNMWIELFDSTSFLFNVALGQSAGETSQSSGAIAIGNASGNIFQGTDAISIGLSSGYDSQSSGSIAIGVSAGELLQASTAIAIGFNAGLEFQGADAIALGKFAGEIDQASGAIAMGAFAGSNSQGTNAIAIGKNAGVLNQASNSIIINASGSNLNNTNSGLYISPIRVVTTPETYTLTWNSATKEIVASISSQPPSARDNLQYMELAERQQKQIEALEKQIESLSLKLSDLLKE